MRCLSKAELILFYYEEFNKLKKNKIKKHLQQCQNCQKEYQAIESFLDGLVKDKIKLPDVEIEKMVNSVKMRIEEDKSKSLIISLREYIYNIFSNNPFPYKKLLPALAGLMIVFVFLSVLVKHNNSHTEYANIETKILQVELELSLDNEDISEFDLYENDLEPIQSLNYPSDLINKV